MAGRDLVQLKLQKRLLEEQLKSADNKLDRLGNILLKKTSSKPWLVHPAEHTMTSAGLTVNEFKIPTRSVKAIPKISNYDPYATDASPITNPNIIRIRQNHGIRTTGQQEVKRQIKEKELAELRKQKPERKIPQIRIPESMLPNRYVRGELPCTIEHGTSGKYLSWACPLENLDYEFYLPVFFDGLQCTDMIVSFIARQGIEDMLYASRGHPERIKSVVHLLVRPLRNALAKFDLDVLLGVLKALEQLITCNEGIGEVLLPYGKQFLAPIAFFMDMNKNIGDSIDYSQRRNNDIGEEVSSINVCVILFLLVLKVVIVSMLQIRRVLELMEEHGGPDALRAIKFSIPLCKLSFSNIMRYSSTVIYSFFCILYCRSKLHEATRCPSSSQ